MLSEQDLRGLEEDLWKSTFLTGDTPTLLDWDTFNKFEGVRPNWEYQNLWNWFRLIEIFPEEVKSAWKPAKLEKKAKKVKL